MISVEQALGVAFIGFGVGAAVGVIWVLNDTVAKVFRRLEKLEADLCSMRRKLDHNFASARSDTGILFEKMNRLSRCFTDDHAWDDAVAKMLRGRTLPEETEEKNDGLES